MAQGRAFDIQVDGLKELRRDLLAMHESYDDILVSAGKKAAMVVIEGARSSASTPQQQKAAQSALKPVATARGAAVRLSNTTLVPYALGAEFGANHNKPRRNRRGERGYVMRGWNNLPVRKQGGYFLWPTIKREGPKIMDAYLDELDRLLRKFGM